MNLKRNSWVRRAKWLVATLAALVIVAQPLPGGARQPLTKPGACCNKCECCVSSDSGSAPQPAAPSPVRTANAKDFQWVTLLNALLPTPVATFNRISSFSAAHSSSSLPLFIRHCTFLI